MTAPAETNILAAPNSKAKMKAKLKAGNKVKADFLEGGWYAVFHLNEKDRNKKKALGYVAAQRLQVVNQATPPKATAVAEKTAGNQPMPPTASAAGAKFVVDLTVPPKPGTAGAKVAAKPSVPPRASAVGEKAAVAQASPLQTNTAGEKTSVDPPPPSEANKAEAKALADQLLPQKANAVEEKAPADKPPQPKASKAEGKAAAVTSAQDDDNEGIILRDITFKSGPRGHEKVFIALNRQATPVLSSIQDASPRVVADFKNVVSVRPGLQAIPVDGSLIKRIRSSYDPSTRILRIVLDLDPAKNYLVNQVLSQKENIYAFDLSEDAENPVR